MNKRTCKDCRNRFSDEGTCPVRFGVSDTDDATNCDTFEPITVFHRITASPEVLAERSVYAHECCLIPDGATSPFIDEIFWFDDEKGDTWDERFDSAWEKATNATVAKLKEVCDAK